MTGPATPAKMAINALNSGAKVWLADLEDASTPDVGQRHRRDPQPARRRPGNPELHLARRARNTGSAPTRRWPSSWPGRAAGTWTNATCSSTASPPWARWWTSACTSSTSPSSSSPTARARTTTCPRWRATSRPGSGTTSSSSPRTTSGIPQGSVRATVLIETIPAAFEMDEILYELRDHASGPERRPLGLPVQHHQVLPRRRARVCPAGPGHRGHDGSVHARLHRAAGQDLPQPRRLRHGRHGCRHPQPPRPRGHRRGLRQGPRRQDPRGQRRLRRLLGGPPRPGAGLPGGVRRRPRRRARTSWTSSAPRSPSPRTSCWTSPPPTARSRRPGCA